MPKTDDEIEMKNLLILAHQEILSLRRDNEILGAKVEMIDLFSCVFFTKPALKSMAMGEDVAWRLQMAIDQFAKPSAEPAA